MSGQQECVSCGIAKRRKLGHRQTNPAAPEAGPRAAEPTVPSPAAPQLIAATAAHPREALQSPVLPLAVATQNPAGQARKGNVFDKLPAAILTSMPYATASELNNLALTARGNQAALDGEIRKRFQTEAKQFRADNDLSKKGELRPAASLLSSNHNRHCQAHQRSTGMAATSRLPTARSFWIR